MNIESLAIGVTATVGLVEVLKKTGLNGKWAPLLSLVIGVGITFLFTQSLSVATLAIGIMTGLSASGAYSGVAAVASSSKE